MKNLTLSELQQPPAEHWMKTWCKDHHIRQLTLADALGVTYHRLAKVLNGYIQDEEMEAKFREIMGKSRQRWETRTMSKQTSPQDCPYWAKGCSAPLCPLEDNLDRAVWYPDEPICRANKYTKGKDWISQQRKVAKQATRTNLFFTKQMLDRGFVVRKGIEGVDPDAKDVALVNPPLENGF